MKKRKLLDEDDFWIALDEAHDHGRLVGEEARAGLERGVGSPTIDAFVLGWMAHHKFIIEKCCEAMKEIPDLSEEEA
jgi:hypothetical protein